MVNVPWCMVRCVECVFLLSVQWQAELVWLTSVRGGLSILVAFPSSGARRAPEPGSFSGAPPSLHAPVTTGQHSRAYLLECSFCKLGGFLSVPVFLVGASAHCRQLLLYSSASSVLVSMCCIRERVLYPRASFVFVNVCCIRECVWYS